MKMSELVTTIAKIEIAPKQKYLVLEVRHVAARLLHPSYTHLLHASYTLLLHAPLTYKLLWSYTATSCFRGYLFSRCTGVMHVNTCVHLSASIHALLMLGIVHAQGRTDLDACECVCV